MTESEFIAALRGLPLAAGAQDLRDDTATLAVGGQTLVLTHDAIAEGVHYRPGTDPADIAWKLVAVNLSDLAAKGAEPLGVLIGATLSDQRFVEGLRAVLETWHVPLLGGDTIALPPGAPQVFGCTAIGRATGPVPLRSGARQGDALWVTGHIGAAMAAFEGDGDAAAYLRPHPRIADGIALAGHVHAMMDVSDGLLLDARRMAEASHCTVDITLDAIPFAPRIADADRFRAASWGDDYQLLFAMPAGARPPASATCIGRFGPAGAAPLLLDGNVPTRPLGYEHR